jgi:hypothetical protein
MKVKLFGSEQGGSFVNTGWLTLRHEKRQFSAGCVWQVMARDMHIPHKNPDMRGGRRAG